MIDASRIISRLFLTLFFLFPVLSQGEEIKEKSSALYSNQGYGSADWLPKRESAIKDLLADKQLCIYSQTPFNTDFCHQAMNDFPTLKGIEIIPPNVVSTGLYTPEVMQRIFKTCSKDMFRAFGYEKPRLVLLYQADIDNKPENGEEWLLVDHYVKPVSPSWGPELLVKNEYILLNLDDCKTLGYAHLGGGGRHRYAYETDPLTIPLARGLHGLMRYRGEYYLYSVHEGKKIQPIGISKFDSEKGWDFKTVCGISQNCQQ